MVALHLPAALGRHEGVLLGGLDTLNRELCGDLGDAVGQAAR